MKRAYLLIIIMVILAGLALLGLAMAEHKGYVLFAYNNFRYESTLWVFLALVVTVFFVVYLLRIAMRLLLVSTGLVNPWSNMHRSRRVRKASGIGFIELSEGHWKRALKHLKGAAKSSPQPLMYYLGAAKAAHNLNDYDTSDNLLNQALEHDPKAELAIALTHAQFEIERDHIESARNTLTIMYERFPDNKQILTLLQQIYFQQKDWAELSQILPVLTKNKILTEGELLKIERNIGCNRLIEIVENNVSSRTHKLEELSKSWSALHSKLREDSVLLSCYAKQLIKLNKDDDAVKLLQDAIKHQYSEELVRLYGVSKGSNLSAQILVAEKWLIKRPKDATLLLTLGRLCQNNKLWGKSKDYFEASARLQSNPEASIELAKLAVQSGDLEKSVQLFQQGIILLEQNNI